MSITIKYAISKGIGKGPIQALLLQLHFYLLFSEEIQAASFKSPSKQENSNKALILFVLNLGPQKSIYLFHWFYFFFISIMPILNQHTKFLI